MRLYEIAIRPKSAFGTPLKGDTLFGHFCWQVAYDPSLLEGGLDGQISRYEQRPFVVFSSAYPRLTSDTRTTYALKRPTLPLSVFAGTDGTERRVLIAKRKEIKQKRWMLVPQSLEIDLGAVEFVSDRELAERAKKGLKPDLQRVLTRVEPSGGYVVDFDQPHNAIDRLSGGTGKGEFAPFMQRTIGFYPESELTVFVLVDEEATDIEKVAETMKRIGAGGFGRDASTGMGRFEVAGHEEITLPAVESANACYCLGPSVPQRDTFSRACFTPFIRFGRHGDRLAKAANPFKNPVIMADEGAVYVPKNEATFREPYLGRAVGGISKASPRTVAQGYSPYLPFRLEM